MGCENDVFHVMERAGRRRFLLPHIQGGAGKPAVLQGLGQVRFGEDFSPRGVDDESSRLHLLKGHGVEQPFRLFIQRKVHGKKIRFAAKLVQRNKGGPGFGHGQAGGGEKDIVGDQTQAKGFGPQGHTKTNLAQSQDSQGFAQEFDAMIFFPLPAAVFDRTVSPGNFSGQG